MLVSGVFNLMAAFPPPFKHEAASRPLSFLLSVLAVVSVILRKLSLTFSICEEIPIAPRPPLLRLLRSLELARPFSYPSCRISSSQDRLCSPPFFILLYLLVHLKILL